MSRAMASGPDQNLGGVRMTLSAVLGNLRSVLVGGGTHRPSIRIGLRLLLRGDWQTFHRQLLKNAGGADASDYDWWRREHRLADSARRSMRIGADGWKNPPLISVLLPVFNVEEIYLRRCIESVLNQIYPHWELCIANDASTAAHIRPTIDAYARRDSRIKVVHREKNGNISAATNSALALAGGQFVAMLDHDDELAEEALFFMAEAIVADPSLEILYSDEDKLTCENRHADPFFKPDWSPEYFLACMYTCHLAVYRTELVRAVGGWRSEFDSARITI